MTRYMMAMDTAACIGCNACSLACKVENGSPAGIWMAPVVEREFGAYPDARKAFLPLLCNHCEDAPCLKACPTQAISKRPDGIVLIDQDICCGTRACVIACPYGAIHFYDRPDELRTPFDHARVAKNQPGVAKKCTFCAPRVDRGLDPACVAACPTGARIFGDASDPKSAVSMALASREAVPLGTPVPTGPSVRYLTEGFVKAGGSAKDIALHFRPQRQWGLVHALQFWFLGVGAGALAMSRFLAPEARLLGLDAGAVLAILLVVGTSIMLTFHLGKPLRFLNALRHWRHSWISRGAIADIVFLAAAAGLVAFPGSAAQGPLVALALISAVVVAAYPAMSMAAIRSVPAWGGARLPAGALVEAAAAGTGLLGLVVGWGGGMLTTLAALAAFRALLAVAWRGHSSERLAVVWSGIILALCAGAWAGAGWLADLAGSAALFASLVIKQAGLDEGCSPSPFGPDGRLGGVPDAAG